MLPIVALEGQVVGEPQLKFGDNGKAMVRFRVKAADRRRTEDGKWEDAKTLWCTVTAFGTLAENCMESLVAGDQVIAVGKWSTAEWTDASGAKRSAPQFDAMAVGAGLQFQPRRHSPETMAKHREVAPTGAPAGQPNAYYGRQYADVAVQQAAQGGGEPVHDPWA
jgi:single stranded DNA-binding protein